MMWQCLYVCVFFLLNNKYYEEARLEETVIQGDPTRPALHRDHKCRHKNALGIFIPFNNKEF